MDIRDSWTSTSVGTWMVSREEQAKHPARPGEEVEALGTRCLDPARPCAQSVDRVAGRARVVGGRSCLRGRRDLLNDPHHHRHPQARGPGLGGDCTGCHIMNSPKDLEAYLDAYGVGCPLTEPGWFIVQFKEGQFGVAFHDGRGGCGATCSTPTSCLDKVNGEFREVFYDRVGRSGLYRSDEFVRHAPLNLTRPTKRGDSPL